MVNIEYTLSIWTWRPLKKVLQGGLSQSKVLNRFCSGRHVTNRLRTISSLTRKLSLSNSRILITGVDRDSPPSNIGEYHLSAYNPISWKHWFSEQIFILRFWEIRFRVCRSYETEIKQDWDLLCRLTESSDWVQKQVVDKDGHTLCNVLFKH